MKNTGLTDSKIRALKAPESGQQEITDAKLPGLRLRVGKSGTKTFIIRKRIHSKMKNITVGRYGPNLSLADARKQARLILNDIEAGKDVGSQSAANAKKTISQFWEDYRISKADLRSISEVCRIFEKHILPQFGSRLPESVKRSEVTAFIDDIKAPVMARAIHAQLSAFFTWIMQRVDDLNGNPCSKAGRPPKPPSRERVLNDDELAAVWQATAKIGYPWSPFVRLLILTGQRREEVLNADHTEFDHHAKLWTLPGTRTKNGMLHRVHLSDGALSVLQGIPIVDGSVKLFPAKGNPSNSASGVSKAVDRLRKQAELEIGHDIPHWSLHDLRRTFATGMQRLGVRLEVTEAIINHTSGSSSGVVGIYQRYDWDDEKRSALNDWSDFVNLEVAKLLDKK